MNSDWWSNGRAPETYNLWFEHYKDEGGTVPLSSFEQLIFQENTTTQFQKDEILRIVSAHAMSNHLDRQNWNIGLGLLGLAQQGEQNLTLGSIIGKPFPEINLPDFNIPSNILNENTAWNGSDVDPLTGSMPMITGEVWKTPLDLEYYDPTTSPRVKVSIAPQREGMFMFRHVVYTLEGTYRASRNTEPTVFKVVRRYSDFVWLYDCLLKRFPFRLIPNLPPKRFTLDGKYLTYDDYFLERRRRGLTRFLDLVMKHPILCNEKFVAMFLTVDTDMSSFRKQALSQITEEISGKVVSSDFVKSWNEADSFAHWRTTYQTTDAMFNIVQHLCHIVDRMNKRQAAIAEDYKRASSCFGKLSDIVGTSVFQGCADLPAITDGIRMACNKTESCSELLADESGALDVGTLEQLKQFRDLLVATKEIFVRYGKLGKNNIPQLERRVLANSEKIKQLENQENSRESDIMKLEELIAKDKETIGFERNRSWLIRQCISDELMLCQRIQYQISKILRDWSLDSTKYAELHSDNWTSLNNEVAELPLPRESLYFVPS